MASEVFLSAVVQVSAYRFRVATLRPAITAVPGEVAMRVEYAEPGEWYSERDALRAAHGAVRSLRAGGRCAELLDGIWVQSEDQLVRPWGRFVQSGFMVEPVPAGRGEGAVAAGRPRLAASA